MRTEYLVAAALLSAALAVPGFMIFTLGDAVPELSGGDSDRNLIQSGPLTLIPPPIMAPALPSRTGETIRTVVAEIDLPDRASADSVCRAHPRLADRILMHLDERGDPSTRSDPINADGHDVRLAWAVGKALDPVEIENIAILDREEVRARRHRRPVYECRGAVAWRKPDGF